MTKRIVGIAAEISLPKIQVEMIKALQSGIMELEKLKSPQTYIQTSSNANNEDKKLKLKVVILTCRLNTNREVIHANTIQRQCVATWLHRPSSLEHMHQRTTTTPNGTAG